MNSVAAWHLRLAPIYALAGMALGNVMGATQDFTLAPVHAHINLLGWASVALYGLILRGNAEAASWRMTRIHFALAHAGALILIGGILSIVGLNQPGIGEKLAMIGGSISFVAMALFAVILFRMTGAKSAAPSSAE